MLVLLVAVAVASISFTISETALFRPIREAVKRKQLWVGELLSCGFCLGHWVALGLVLAYRPRLFHSQWAGLDYGLTVLCVAWAAAFQWILLVILFKAAGK